MWKLLCVLLCMSLLLCMMYVDAHYVVIVADIVCGLLIDAVC